MAKTDSELVKNMRDNDKFIAELLEPLEKSMGFKFNQFVKTEDPKYEDPKKKANLKLQLKKAERKQKRMTPEKAREQHWKNALTKARGGKIKDDPKLIKKTIKKKENDKKRHKKQWAERVEGQKNRKEMKDKIRKNKIINKGKKKVNKKVDKKVNKKVAKKVTKKGRSKG